jgi:hypothetical protein
MYHIKATKEMVPYIHHQRTKYYKKNIFFKVLSNLQKISPVFGRIKFFIFANGIIKKFQKDINTEFSRIKLFLPKESQNILDIGSGMAAIDILVSNHYGHKVNIHLLDKAKLDTEIYYGFENKASYYNSFDLALKMLTDNGVSRENIHMHDTEDLGPAFQKQKYDLVTSFISWGFHYPISTYIQQVSDSMLDNGVLIVDVRKDTDGLNEIKKYYKNVSIIYKTPFLDRVYAVK